MMTVTLLLRMTTQIWFLYGRISTTDKSRELNRQCVVLVMEPSSPLESLGEESTLKINTFDTSQIVSG